MQDRRPEPSLGDLFSDLTRDMGTLVRKEVELARTEMTQKASNMSKDVALIAAGGVLAFAGFLVLLSALVIILGTLGVPWWLSALLVGLIVVGVGGLLIMKGRDALKSRSVTPRQTIETLKEDAEWVKEQTR